MLLFQTFENHMFYYLCYYVFYKSKSSLLISHANFLIRSNLSLPSAVKKLTKMKLLTKKPAEIR